MARSQDDIREIEWEGRVPPITDTKAITAWNALMISGLATAYRAFQKPVYKQLAVNAAKFIQLEVYLQTIIRSEILESIPFIGELDKSKIQ